MYPEQSCMGAPNLEAALASRMEQNSHRSVAQASKERSLVRTTVKPCPSDPSEKGR